MQGSNRDGAWSPHELKIPVEVRAAWWQTRWALALALLGAVLVVVAIVNGRTRLLLRHRRVLEARVQERTEALEAATAALTAKSIELEEASLTDPLTGLRNRRFLDRQMPADVALSVRHYEASPADRESEQDLLFFLIDIDHFKRINDAHGHMAGDAVLMQMRGRLEQVFRATDYLVRWGGEEFLIVARGTPRSRAAELAERARLAVAALPFDLGAGVRVAHVMEDCLVEAQDGRLLLQSEHIDALLQGCDALSLLPCAVTIDSRWKSRSTRSNNSNRPCVRPSR